MLQFTVYPVCSLLPEMNGIENSMVPRSQLQLEALPQEGCSLPELSAKMIEKRRNNEKCRTIIAAATTTTLTTTTTHRISSVTPAFAS